MVNARRYAIADETRPSKLNLWSMKHLEASLGLPLAPICSLSTRAGSAYAPFVQYKKPKPFAKVIAPPKPRPIDNPSAELKSVQRLINRRLLGKVLCPGYLLGGMMGRSVVENAQLHLGQRVLVTLDIRSFFPSITNRHVYRVWQEVLGCSPKISSLLTRLTTFERHLPQGAPTSTALANLVLYSVDKPIREFCRAKSIVYSTWVDDLAFSGDDARAVIQVAVDALRIHGFAISHKKLQVMTFTNN